MSLRSMRLDLRAIFALMALVLVLGVQGARASNVITGSVEKVDTTAKTIAVKTSDGTVHVVKYAGDATVSGLKGVAHGTDLAGKESGHVIVHTVGTGADETARSIVWVGDKTVKTTDGVVEDTGKGVKVMSIKTADGTKETFVIADHATIDTGKDIGKYSVVGAEKGEHVTVYYTESAGKKIAHVFEHL
jgi:hypothetical protein